MSEEQTLEGYCLKCKEKRIMAGPQPEWAANGSPATRGTCPVCGGSIYRRGHTPAHDALPKPETQPAKKAATQKTGKTPKTKAAKPAKTPAAQSAKPSKTTAKGGGNPFN